MVVNIFVIFCFFLALAMPFIFIAYSEPIARYLRKSGLVGKVQKNLRGDDR